MRIDGMTIPDERVQQLVEDIKKGRYLVDEALVLREIGQALRGQRKTLESLSAKRLDARSRRSAWYKNIIKAVRTRLRRRVRMFERDERHLSMEERGPHPRRVYEKMFTITGRPQRIIDIACGLHPLSFPKIWLDAKRTRYIAWDVSEECIRRVREFFEKQRVDGEAHVVDVLKLRSVDLFAHVPTQDVCFLFKALDSLEPASGHKFAELLITKVPARYVIASFSTRTISGKPMRHPYRGWMDRMLKRLGYEFRVFVESDEIFYVVKK